MSRLLNEDKKKLEEQVIQKIWSDLDFKRQFIENPQKMLSQHFGIHLPQHMKVHTHFEKVNEIHVVLPK